MCLLIFNEDTMETLAQSAPLLAAVSIEGILGLTREVIIYVLSRFKGICFFLCGSNQRRVWFCSPRATLHSWHLGVLQRSIVAAPFLRPRGGTTPPGPPLKPERSTNKHVFRRAWRTLVCSCPDHRAARAWTHNIQRCSDTFHQFKLNEHFYFNNMSNNCT